MIVPRYEPRRLVVTIDGPAGTGKSTVAGQLAARLGLEFLDTGAMYRAVALVALERGIDPADGPALAAEFRTHTLRFEWGHERPRLMLDGRDVSRRIRELDVGAVVSTVAACPEVREVMVEAQRRIAEEHPRLVTEGRDQGSKVFPDAPVRIYLTADLEVRTRRRQAQLEAMGKRIDSGAVRADIAGRDQLDAARAEGPLIKPEGAIEVDTTELGLAEVVDLLEEIVRARLPREANLADPCMAAVQEA